MADTPFLRHGLLLGGRPYGEQFARGTPTRERYDRTYAENPRTPVSIAEFERDMATVRAARASTPIPEGDGDATNG